MTDEAGPDLNQRIAARVRQLRAGAGLSLEALAQRSGVSRSMISLVERGEASPTAVVLERLATGLGSTLAALFDPPTPAPAEPVARRAQQPLWQDPATGYQRRNLSPPGVPSPLHLVEVQFPPGATVAYESGARVHTVHQQVWLISGQLTVTSGPNTLQLQPGDCWAMTLDQPNSFHNPGHSPAHYLVAVVDSTPRRA